MFPPNPDGEVPEPTILDEMLEQDREDSPFDDDYYDDF
jgi:hypothetical protein